MIKRQEYLDALDLVNRYTQQESLIQAIESDSPRDMYLKNGVIGGYIEYVRHIKAHKHFTLGKKYQILDKIESDNCSWKNGLKIRCDNGCTRLIPFKNHYRIWSVINVKNK